MQGEAEGVVSEPHSYNKKVREKIDNAIKAAKKAAETARQKAEIAIPIRTTMIF